MLVVVLPATGLLADSNSAMLRTSGVVTVNGTVTSNASAVFDGDAIRTADNANVVITASGSMVAVPSASSIIYRRKAVELASGAVDVTTSNGLAAKADNFTVTPASSGSVKYEVTKQDRNVVIAAKQGSVMVFDGTSRKFLKEGSTTDGGGSESKDRSGANQTPATAAKGPGFCCVLPAVGGLAGSVVAVSVDQRQKNSISSSSVH